METAVRKATRLDYNSPKLKHLFTLKAMTFDNPASIDGILMTLEKRLKERSWIVTYKVLAVIHYLMREGNCMRVVDGVVKRPGVLDASRIKNKSSAPANVHNIYLYRVYLDDKVIAFRHLRRDYATEESSSEGQGRLRHLSIKDGLLKELAFLQRQIESVVKCSFYLEEGDPSITIFVYRMTIQDSISVFQAVNEGIVNLLEHYFELPKPLAATAFEIYKTFVEQTEHMISFLDIARKAQSKLEIDIPSINHAPLTLSNALEEYIKSGTVNNERTISKEPSPFTTAKSEPSIPQLQQSNSLSTSNSNTSTSYFDSIFNEKDSATKEPINQPVMIGLSPQNPFNPLMKGLPQSPIQDPFVNNDSTFSQPFSTLISPNHTQNMNGQPVRSDSNPFRVLPDPNVLTDSQNPLIRSTTSPDSTASFQDPNITGYNPFSPVTLPITPNQAFPPQMGMQQNTMSYHHVNPFINTVQHAAFI